MFTYSEELFSDFHKDTYGFRPREYHPFWNATPEQKQKIWDAMSKDFDHEQEREHLQTATALREFDQWVADIIECFGAKDRTQALRWMTGPNTFYNEQDVEHWVWEQGILFTDEGRALVKELMEIVEFKEYV
jgi:hypothetical protein